MAKADAKLTVELSNRDRALLRDVVDAIRSLKPVEEPEGPGRLVEGAMARKTSDGQPLPDDESYYRDADGRLRREGGGW